jgi:hypothetical protein
VIDRNTKGSPVAQLRTGPGSPPSGSGSLGLLIGGTGSPTDQTNLESIAYGVHISGDPKLANLDTISFAVFPTGEDLLRAPNNMPRVSVEIDPHITDATAKPITYTTLEFFPNGTRPNAWTTIDATQPDTGSWVMTGAAGTTTGCRNSLAGNTGCPLDTIKQKIPDATILYTLAISKGRDYPWQGAVDALRINDRTADFEEGGVIIRATS